MYKEDIKEKMTTIQSWVELSELYDLFCQTRNVSL